MTGLTLMMLCGGLAGAGLTTLIAAFLPTRRDLGQAVEMLSPSAARTRATRDVVPVAKNRYAALGSFMGRIIPAGWWGTVPSRELRLLDIDTHEFYGRKVASAIAGFVIFPLAAITASIVGIELPVIIPAAGSIGLAAAMFILATGDVVSRAVKARAQFTRAMSAYIDLVALERNAGVGPSDAMLRATMAGDSWVFRRIREALERARLAGNQPWHELRDLAEELGVPELAELGEIMTLTGEQGAEAYASLRARAGSIRAQILARELKESAAVQNRLTLQGSLCAIVFMALLITPLVTSLF